jgi:hypothetical protein
MHLSALAFLGFIASAAAHTHMFFPDPRGQFSYAFQNGGQNACETDNQFVPPQNKFQRGQAINVKWWWNNHRGGFIKFALKKNVEGFVQNAVFLDNKNVIQAQCHTGGCDQNGFDPGDTKPCNGKPLVIPNWVEDGTYVLQWSQIGSFDSEGIPTKLLPIYHTCANIVIEGGVPFVPQPADWIAPFIGGSQDQVNGQPGGNDVCAFKQFNAEPANPGEVDVNRDAFANTMQFGQPGGFARLIQRGLVDPTEQAMVLRSLGRVTGKREV